MKNLVVIFILVSSFFIFQSCSETRVLYCGEGKTDPVLVLKNPEKAYKKYEWARTFSTNIKGTVDVLEKVKVGEGEVLFQSDLESFKEKLTNESSRMAMLVRENAKAFNAGACKEDVRKRFFDFQEALAQKNSEIEKLRLELKKIVDGSGIGNDDYKKIIVKISKFEDQYEFQD